MGREVCHCGAMHRRGREYPGELCSLCHYAPLTAADYRALPRKVREIIRDATSGVAEIFDEGWLTDHGIIVSDDWKSAGKAADVWRGGKPVLGLDGKPGKPSSCDSLSRSFVFGNQRGRSSGQPVACAQVPGPRPRSDSPVATGRPAAA